MKKIYSLIVFAVVSASVIAQSIDKSNLLIIKKTIPYANLRSAGRMMLSPDTTGLVNYVDFLPQFAPSSSYALYTYSHGGYLYGNNADSLNVCAQGYANLNHTPVRILGVLMWFGAKQSDAGSATTSKVVAKAWGISPNKAFNTDSSATLNTTVANWSGPATANNLPDASADLLFTNIDTINFNYVSFAVPPVYTGDFAVGVDFSSLAVGDTAGLASDYQNDAFNMDYTYHLYHNQWLVSDQLFSTPGSPNFGSGGLDNNIAIWAVIDAAPCFSHYTTTYDSTLHTFNLTVDSVATSFATGYHWDFGDGSTSTLAAPTHIYAVDSLYNVCLKIYTATGDSCEYCHIIGIDSLGGVVHASGFTLHVINSSTASVKDIQNENTVTIAPNPFNSQSTLSFSYEQIKTNITITDILGKEIKSTTFSGKQYIIEKGEMKPGIYFVRTIDLQKHICNKKIIVQ
jgi:hypothetical protein